jgi:triphosphoribosyl-dephospho-CoA synthetase
MSDENNDHDFDKVFEEIVNSDDLKQIKENYDTDVRHGVKELILIQQSLADVSGHISEILLRSLSENTMVFGDDNVYHNLLSSIYKISEDFNEYMVDYYIVIDDDMDIDLFDEDEDGGEDE